MAEQESLIQTDYTDPRVAVRVRELREQLGRMPTGKEVQDSLVLNPPQDPGTLTVFNPDLTRQEAKAREVANIRLNKNLPKEEPGDMSENRPDYDQKQQDLQTLGLADVFGNVGEVFYDKIGKPVMDFVGDVNTNILQKSGGELLDEGIDKAQELIGVEDKVKTDFKADDLDPPKNVVPITEPEPDQADPVVEVRETIEETADQFRETFPEVVETIVEKVPVNKQEAMDLVKDIAPLIVEKLGVTPPKQDIEEITLEAEPKNVSEEPARGTAIVESVRTTSKPPELTSPTAQKISLDQIAKYTENPELKEVINRVEYKPFFKDGVELLAVQEIDKRITENNKKLEAIGQRKIKPFFGKDDTGKKFLAAIAAGLGAYASAMTGTKNFALDIINQAIADDLAIQKEQLEREKVSVENQNVILAEQRSQLYKEAEMMMQDAINKIASDTDRAQLIQESEKLKLKGVESHNKVIEALIESNAETVEQQRQRLVKIRGGYAEYGPTKTKAQIDKDQQKVDTMITGLTSMLGDPESSIPESQQGVIQQLIDLVEEKPLESLVPGTDAYALVSSLHTQMKSFYQRDIVQAGANLTNTEVKIVNDIVSKPNPFNIVTGTYINKLNTLIRELKVKEDQYLRQRDIIPVGKQATFRKYDPKKKGKTIVTGDN